MNPLSLPDWNKPKEEDPRTGNNQSLGLKAEAVMLDKDAKHHVVIEVRGAKGVHPGVYKLAWQEGRPLGDYLRRLRVKRAACYSAVYDINAKNRGRLRMSYIPNQDSHIVIGSSALGVANQFQRSSVDAQRVAANMGGGRKVVEVDKQGGQ